MKKSGYLYVLIHPSNPNLFKIGVTVGDITKRLEQHNAQFDKKAGLIVKETGQKWQIKTYIEVPDTYYAELKFWASTPYCDLPGGHSEVQEMPWHEVERGLKAASAAGTRPVKNIGENPKDRALQSLAGSGWSMIGRWLGPQRLTDFACEAGHMFNVRPQLLVERYQKYGLGCPTCNELKT
jgi:hypothetical protein